MMTDPDNELIQAAAKHVPQDAELAACWDLVVRGVQMGWLDRAELGRLHADLALGQDYGNEELRIDHIDERLRVKFLDEIYWCEPRALSGLIERTLQEGAHPGTITYLEDDKIVSVRKVDEVPERARFAETANGLVPIVRVVRRMMGDSMAEIVEYGPNGERLRSTVQMRG